jgi:hypothetical protein
MEFVWGIDERRSLANKAKVHTAVPEGLALCYRNCAISYCSAWDHVKFFYGKNHDKVMLWEGGDRRNVPHAERRKLYEAQYELMRP